MNPNSAPNEELNAAENPVMAGESSSLDRLDARANAAERAAAEQAAAATAAAEKEAQADTERELIAQRAKLRDLDFT